MKFVNTFEVDNLSCRMAGMGR